MSFTTRKEMLKGVQEHDEKSWEDFVEYYGQLVDIIGSHLTLTVEELKDLRQEVWLAVSQRNLIARYDQSRGRFKTLLQTVIHNCAVDVLRRRPGVLSLEIETMQESEIDRLVEEEWKNILYNQALEILRQNCEEKTYLAFDLYARKGMPVEQVMEMLEMTKDQVFQIKSRLQKRLREIISTLEKDEDL